MHFNIPNLLYFPQNPWWSSCGISPKGAISQRHSATVPQCVIVPGCNTQAGERVCGGQRCIRSEAMFYLRKRVPGEPAKFSLQGW